MGRVSPPNSRDDAVNFIRHAKCTRLSCKNPGSRNEQQDTGQKLRADFDVC